VHRTFGNAEGSASVDWVILGVDTHLELHVAVAVDQVSSRLGELTIPSSIHASFQRLATHGVERYLTERTDSAPAQPG
jgi:hypothetical protein